MDGFELSNESDPRDSTLYPQLLETGETSINHKWKEVTLNHKFADPVVVAKPMTYQGSNPAVVRIRNVSNQSFEIRIQEWDYLDGVHLKETVSYLVMESGHFTLPDGTQVEAGNFQTNSSLSVDFQQDFFQVPVVTTAVTSNNDQSAITGRIEDINVQGLSFTLQEEEANDQKHGQENISYIAWEPSTGEVQGLSYDIGQTQNQVTRDPHFITFNQGFPDTPVCLADMQTFDGLDTANLRTVYKDAYGLELKVTEETSKDSEIYHTNEVIGYMAIEQNY